MLDSPMTKTGGSGPLLSDEVLDLMNSGVDVYVATRDAALNPESMLAMGLKVHDDRRTVTVHLPEKLAAATVANLNANGLIAVTASRASDLRTVQVKGRATRIRPSDECDRESQLVFRAALVEQLAFVGVPRSATRRLLWWPSIAVEVCVAEVFAQTPGPRAGERIAGSVP